jgi:NlpC/P60 family/Lysozyme like domain
MFDAGTIIAHLDLEDNDFDRKLRADVARIEAFERGDHEVKLSVDLDQAGIDRARAQIERLDRQATQDAKRRGGIMSWLSGAPGGIASAAGPGLNTGPLARLFNARTASIIAGGAVGLGAVPSILGAGLGGGIGLAGAGVAALGSRLLIGTKQKPGELYAPAHQAMQQLQNSLKQAAQPLVGPLRQIFHELPGLMRGLQGPLRQMFAGAATTLQPLVHGLADLARNVLPLLGQAFRASAPLIRPLLHGLSQLMTGLLPGVITIIRAAKPAMDALSSVLGTLGRGVGGMLRAMAPAIRASAIIFKGLGDLLGALFPIVGKLAAAFARNLAPVFSTLVGVIRQLLPFLRPIGDVLAKLAGAVLRDLVALLRPLADLLVRIAPSFDILAKALGNAFTVLENSGVFGVLANALEQIVPPLARLINDLVKQLAPYFPVIIAGFSGLLDILVALTAAGLTVVLNAVDGLIRAFPALVPLVVGSYLAFKGYQMVSGWVGTARKAIQWLTAEEQINRVKSVANMIIDVAKRVWATAVIVAQGAVRIATATAVFIAENAATLGIIAGIALLVAAIIYLATHWKQVWGVVKRVAEDVWNFLTHGWGQYLIPGLFLIRKVVEFVRDHWRDAWNLIKNTALDAWHFIHDNIVSPLVDTFTRTIPNAFSTAVRWIGQRWDDIKGVIKAPVAWVVDNVLDGLIRVFDWITSKVGLGKPINEVHPFGLATGGRIPGYGGGDRHLALLEGGEAVISKETTSRNADVLAAWGVPGFQQGGIAGARANLKSLQRASNRSGGWLGDLTNGIGGLVHKALDIGKITTAIFTGNTTALVNAISDLVGGGVGGASAEMAKLLTAIPRELIHEVASHLIHLGGGASANAIVRFAESFIGKVPYVWGGTTPQGWDCSGFVEWIYNHFGIHPPRTSEAQWGWVRRTGQPTPGGLAFFAGSDGSVANPGHVGIVIDPRRVVDAYGTGFGTRIDSIAGIGGVSGFGIPPAGFGGGGRGTAQRGSWNFGGLEGLWRQAGGPAWNERTAAAIALAESGGNPLARNPSGASGLWQILGQVFPGNIFNPYINARNAVRKYYDAGGFSPWVTYMTGAYRQFMDQGGWMHGGPYFNMTGRPEAVLNPSQSAAFLNLAEAAHRMSRGQGAGGSLVRDVHLMLPEGTTIAEALREIGWALRTTRQQSFAGVPGG